MAETKNEADTNPFCIIRIRGNPSMKRKIQYTLQLLNLHKANHCTIVPDNSSIRGMLQKAKDYIAFGKPSEEMIEKLLEKRARIRGNKPLTDSHIRYSTVYKSKSDLAKAIHAGKIGLKEVKDLKPVFRLHPPKGGFPGSVKKAVGSKGVLGNIEERIDMFLHKMI